jgi:hypothetical protein
MAKKNLNRLAQAANCVLFLSGIACLIFGLLYLRSGSAGLATLGLTAGLLLLFGATIDRFESLKGLGLEAKTKRLDQKIDQAEDIFDSLRALTEHTSASFIKLSAKVGRFDSAPSPAEMYKQAQEVRKAMREMGSNGEAIADVLQPWVATTCFDAGMKLLKGLREALNTKAVALGQDVAHFPKPIDPASEDYKLLLVRQRLVTRYLQEELTNLHLLKVEDYPDKLIDLVDAAPDLQDAEKSNLKIPIKDFTGEFEYLKSNLDYKDPDRWYELMGRR